MDFDYPETQITNGSADQQLLVSTDATLAFKTS